MKTLIVTLAGGLTSFLTAVGLIVLQEATGFSLYGLTMCLIVPVGAIIAGAVGATGYYAGARLVGCRPSGWLALNMVVVAAGTFFLIHYLTYRASDVKGVPLNQLMGFPEYLDETIRSTVIKRARGGNNGEAKPLGVWGYPLAALKVLGFAVGGLGVFAVLADKPYCRPCGRFLKAEGETTRCHATEDDAGRVIEAMHAAFEARDPDALQPALDAHAATGAVKDKNSRERTTFRVMRCAGCSAGQVRFRHEHYDGENWSNVADAERTVETDAETQLAVGS